MNVLDAAVYSKLQGTTAITSQLSGTTAIYSVQAKDGEALPYIVFNIQGGGDENMDAHRTKNIIMFVRAYSQTSKAQAGSIDSAVDTAIHRQSLTVSGWANFWTARESDLETVQVQPDGQKIYMVGGLYRVRIEKT